MREIEYRTFCKRKLSLCAFCVIQDVLDHRFDNFLRDPCRDAPGRFPGRGGIRHSLGSANIKIDAVAHVHIRGVLELIDRIDTVLSGFAVRKNARDTRDAKRRKFFSSFGTIRLIGNKRELRLRLFVAHDLATRKGQFGPNARRLCPRRITPRGHDRIKRHTVTRIRDQFARPLERKAFLPLRHIKVLSVRDCGDKFRVPGIVRRKMKVLKFFLNACCAYPFRPVEGRFMPAGLDLETVAFVHIRKACPLILPVIVTPLLRKVIGIALRNSRKSRRTILFIGDPGFTVRVIFDTGKNTGFTHASRKGPESFYAGIPGRHPNRKTALDRNAEALVDIRRIRKLIHRIDPIGGRFAVGNSTRHRDARDRQLRERFSAVISIGHAVDLTLETGHKPSLILRFLHTHPFSTHIGQFRRPLISPRHESVRDLLIE